VLKAFGFSRRLFLLISPLWLNPLYTPFIAPFSWFGVISANI
jgi:hypothetical protein